MFYKGFIVISIYKTKVHLALALYLKVSRTESVRNVRDVLWYVSFKQFLSKTSLNTCIISVKLQYFKISYWQYFHDFLSAICKKIKFYNWNSFLNSK